MNPKVTIIGGAKTAAKYIPRSRAILKVLLHRGTTFSNKYTFEKGAFAVISSYGDRQEIFIKGEGLPYYEFATCLEASDGRSIDTRFVSTRLRKDESSPEGPPVVSARVYKGIRYDPAAEDWAKQSGFVDYVMMGNRKEPSDPSSGSYYLGPVDTWYRINLPEDLDAREAILSDAATHGFRRSIGALTVVESSYIGRYFSGFYHANAQIAQIIAVDTAVLQREGVRGRRLLSFQSGSLPDGRTQQGTGLSTPGTSGAVSVVEGIELRSNGVGFDHVFEAVRSGSSSGIWFTTPVPSWHDTDPSKGAETGWRWSPDGRRAVCAQVYGPTQDDGTKGDGEPHTGIVESKFFPAADTTPGREDKVVCPTTKGLDYYEPGVHIYAADYDMYDSSIIRAAIVRSYVKEGAGEDEAELQCVLEIVEFDESGAMSDPIFSRTIAHLPWLASTGGSIGSYNWFNARVGTLDLRAKAWAISYQMEHTVDESTVCSYGYEFWMWGVEKKRIYYDDSGAEIEDWPETPPDDEAIAGYVPLVPGHDLWEENKIWKDVDTRSVSAQSFTLYLILFRIFSSWLDALGSFLAVHPDRSYATKSFLPLVWPLDLSIFGGQQHQPPLVLTHDEIAYSHFEKEDPGTEILITTTHIDAYNEAYGTEHVYDPEDYPIIGFTGIWTI